MNYLLKIIVLFLLNLTIQASSGEEEMAVYLPQPVQALYESLKNGPNFCVDTVTLQATKLRDDCDKYYKRDEEDVNFAQKIIQVFKGGRGKTRLARSLPYPQDYTSQSCNKIRDYFQCHTTKQVYCWRNETLTTYGCCYGYAQEPGKTGCPNKLNLQSLEETMQNNGLGYYKSYTRAMKGNVTVFVPEEGALKRALDLAFNTGYNIGESISLAHTVTGIYERSHMLQNLILPTDGLTVPNIRISFTRRGEHGPIIKWTANCIPLSQGSDLQTTQGLIIKLKGILPLQPINETVYQYLSRNPQYSIILEKWMAAGYGRMLKNSSLSFTYLIPSNTNFERLNGKFGLNDPTDKCANETIKHHVIDEWICPNALDYVSTYRAQDGTDVRFDPIKGVNKILVEGTGIIRTKMATNGHMIFLEDVIISEKSVPLFYQLSNEPEAREFMQLIQRVYGDSSKNFRNSPFGQRSADQAVVLVPGNEAFQVLDVGTLDQLRTNLTYGRQFLENHILSAEEWDSFHIESIPGDTSHVHLPKVLRPDRLNCIRTVGPSKQYCGGKYVFIPKTMKPITKGLIQTLEDLNDKDISVFIDLLKGSGIQWDPNYQFTVWVPTNKNLLPLVKPYGNDYRRYINNMTLVDIVERHVKAGVNEDQCCDALSNQFIQNPALFYPFNKDGSSLWMDKDESLGGTISVNILKCDVLAKDWLIHIVDRPLMGSVIKLFPNSTYVHNRDDPFWAMD